jgi:hypothetical protein
MTSDLLPQLLGGVAGTVGRALESGSPPVYLAMIEADPEGVQKILAKV